MRNLPPRKYVNCPVDVQTSEMPNFQAVGMVIASRLQQENQDRAFK
jgi:hypothetical protein